MTWHGRVVGIIITTIDLLSRIFLVYEDYSTAHEKYEVFFKVNLNLRVSDEIDQSIVVFDLHSSTCDVCFRVTFRYRFSSV
jgi:hypothetical protein